ncbi:3,4-dihydroxy-2-butanone-4-phosphate synthase [Paenalcaligenes hominis]|uniref:3,4-dihydroxy-2-butanone-4-phosphate synthase n=1 Tax=Paenalcaligenes hominis TaxID=643674 RepID=UPI003524C675
MSFTLTLQSSIEQRVQTAITAIQQGLPVILLDDYDRENEADLIIAAEKITPHTMAQMIRDGSGIVCLCLTDPTLDHLKLPQMVTNNQSQNQTAFTVSIEAKNGVSTGVSAQDRVNTIRAAIHPQAQATDIVSPGHVFPLRAHPQGLDARQGHTEGAVHLAQLAGLRPMAVLCELMNPDGTMMRGEQLLNYAHQHALPLLAIADLMAYSAFSTTL